MAPEGETSWYGKVITESIVPITSEQFVSAAKRPKYSVLNSGKLKSTFAVSLPPWQYSLEKVMGSL